MNSCKTGLNKFFFFSAIFTWILRSGFVCFLLACHSLRFCPPPLFRLPCAGYPAYQPNRRRIDLLKHKMEGLQKELAGLRQHPLRK